MPYNQEIILDFPQMMTTGKHEIYFEMKLEGDTKEFLRVSWKAIPGLRKLVDKAEEHIRSRSPEGLH